MENKELTEKEKVERFKITDKKIQRFICNTYEEYLDALKKIEEYVEWCEEHKKCILNSFWFSSIGEENYNIEDFSHIVLYSYNCLNETELNNLKKHHNDEIVTQIVDEVIANLGKHFKSGTLIGLQNTEEDLYYVYKDDDGEINYNTCVGGIDE